MLWMTRQLASSATCNSIDIMFMDTTVWQAAAEPCCWSALLCGCSAAMHRAGLRVLFRQLCLPADIPVPGEQLCYATPPVESHLLCKVHARTAVCSHFMHIRL
jgi:hypothetical protein